MSLFEFLIFFVFCYDDAGQPPQLHAFLASSCAERDVRSKRSG